MYTDTLREDVKEVNHHGKPRKVDGDDEKDDDLAPVGNIVTVAPADLKHRREDKEVAARKQFYEEIARAQLNKEKIRRCKQFGRRDIPAVVTVFVITYWAFGLSKM